MFRRILVTAAWGFMLVGLGVPVLVLLDIPGLSLQTGIRLLDSLLYSLGGGPSAIAAAAVVWAIVGAVAGGVLGFLLGIVAWYTAPGAAGPERKFRD